MEQTLSDPEFAEAVWAGEVPQDEAPPWYPHVVRLLDAARAPGPPSKAELARTVEAWTEVKRRAEQRKRRRRRMVVRAVAAGAALVAGATAAAAATDVEVLPLLPWESSVDRREAEPPGVGAPAEPTVPEPAEVDRRGPPEEAKPRCPKKGSAAGNEKARGTDRSCGKAEANGHSEDPPGKQHPDKPGKGGPKKPRRGHT